MQLTVLSAVLPLITVALAKTTIIAVGKGGLKFVPDTVTADKGDVLEFQFYPQDHNVAQSAFDKPCVADETGIWSDFMPVKEGVGNETFSVTVNGTDPLWLYCSQGQHCNAGMAMVVNEPKSGDKTLKAYLDAAKQATPTSPQGEAHGGIVASLTNSTSNSTSASPTASGTTTTQASGTSTAPAASSTTGAAVKLETAGLAVLGLAGLVVGGMI